eukprot:m.943489 g.943489  ORF g.943489 m.943489 type:complete len:620 (-) comp23840_c0_seq18:430-2289(-)
MVAFRCKNYNLGCIVVVASFIPVLAFGKSTPQKYLYQRCSALRTARGYSFPSDSISVLHGKNWTECCAACGDIAGCATWTWHENGCWLHKSPKDIPATACGDGSICVSGDNGVTPLPPTPSSPSPPVPAGKDALLLLPSMNHLQFHADNIGAIIHFNMQTMVPSCDRHCCKTWDPSVFNPEELDTDQWLEAISSFGGKYAILVVDHFSGFSPYPTAQHNYSVARSNWLNGQGDVVKDFVASCAKYDVRPGFYYSVHENWYANVSSFNTSDPALQGWFQDLALAQLAEIQDYFPVENVSQVWFDAGIKQSNETFLGQMNEWIDNFTQTSNATCHSCENMPSASAVHWMGNENANMGYPAWYSNTATCTHSSGIDPTRAPIVNGSSAATRWCAPHCDAVLREHIWFWKKDPPPPKDAEALVRQYLSSVGRGCNMVMDLQPAPNGSLVPADVAAYHSWGMALDALFSTTTRVASIAGSPPAMTLQWAPDRSGAIPLSYGAVEVMENLSLGQTVQEFMIEYRLTATQAWRRLDLYDINGKVNTSFTVGRRRIQLFKVSPNVTVDRFRITILQHVNATKVQQETGQILPRPTGTLPCISEVSVYSWQSLSPTAVGFDPKVLLPI